LRFHARIRAAEVSELFAAYTRRVIDVTFPLDALDRAIASLSYYTVLTETNENLWTRQWVVWSCRQYAANVSRTIDSSRTLLKLFSRESIALSASPLMLFLGET